MTESPPKDPPPNPISLGVRIPAYKCGGYTAQSEPPAFSWVVWNVALDPPPTVP